MSSIRSVKSHPLYRHRPYNHPLYNHPPYNHPTYSHPLYKHHTIQAPIVQSNSWTQMAARRVLLLSSPLCERSRICPLLNTTPPTASLLLPEQFLLSKSHRVQYSSDATRDKGPPSTSAGRVSCRLESRGVVAVSGPDAFHFMQVCRNFSFSEVSWKSSQLSNSLKKHFP